MTTWQTAKDIYEPWRQMISGGNVPIHADTPYPGRYALKRGDRYLPVAIGPDASGVIIALVDGQRESAAAIWVSCAKRPISQEAYKFRMANGRWEDEPKPLDRSNRPSDPLEALLADVKDVEAQADELLKRDAIATQVEANLFRNMQARILALKRQADEMHKREKEPVIEAQRRIDTKYRFRDTLVSLAANLKLRFEAFMIGEERRRLAAQAAEQAQLDAEYARKLEDYPVAALSEDAPTAAPIEKVQSGGGFGRRSGLRSIYRATLVDLGAACVYFKDEPKLADLIQKLANARVKAGVREIPGFDIKEGRKAA